MTDHTATDHQTPPQEPEKPKSKRHGLGRWSGASLAVGLAVAGLGAGRLGLLWPGFDVFTQLTAQFAMAALAFTAGLFLPRHKALAGLALLIAMLTAYGLWPHYVSAEPAAALSAPAGSRAIRVASFNTWRGNRTPDALEAEINRLDADVLVLTEFTSNKATMAQRLATRYPHQYGCASAVPCYLAILSKLPLSDTESSSDPVIGPGYVRARLPAAWGGLTVFGVHTLRFPYSAAQFRQMVALRRVVENAPEPRLVMGDFNATPYSRLLASFASETGLVRQTHLPSWPATFGLPQIAIDHIFSSPGVMPLSPEQIGNNAGSDHYPVSMTLAVPVP